MTVDVVDNPDKTLTISFDAEGRTLVERVATERTTGQTPQQILDTLLTSWLAHHNNQFDVDDFQKLTPKQKKKALEEGKKVP